MSVDCDLLGYTLSGIVGGYQCLRGMLLIVVGDNVCQLCVYVYVFLGDPASQSTPIRWKEGNDLTKKGKEKNVGKGRKRAMEQKTFFNWFTDHGDPSADDIAEVIVWS